MNTSKSVEAMDESPWMPTCSTPERVRMGNHVGAYLSAAFAVLSSGLLAVFIVHEELGHYQLNRGSQSLLSANLTGEYAQIILMISAFSSGLALVIGTAMVLYLLELRRFADVKTIRSLGIHHWIAIGMILPILNAAVLTLYVSTRGLF